MMKRVMVCFLSMICLIFGSSCSFSHQTNEKSSDDLNISGLNNHFSYQANAKYNLYIGLLGNVGYIQIRDISANGIDYGNPYVFDFKKRGLNVGGIASVNKKLYASLYDDTDHHMQNKVFVLKRNQLVKTIEFPKHRGLSKIILDKEHHMGYVMCMVQPSRYNPLGTPFVTFNTQSGKPQKTIHLKGILGGYAISGNDIYMAVFGAKKTGYNDVPDQYIARMDRTSGKIDVLTGTNVDKPNQSVRDLTASSSKLYLLTGSHNDNGELGIYNLDGSFVQSIPLKDYPAHLALNQHGILYISHVGGEYHGQEVTVFNTKTDKVIKTIKGFDGAGAMQIQDHYLFVDNEGSSSVAVIDMNTNRIVGTVKFGIKTGSHGLAVFKN